MDVPEIIIVVWCLSALAMVVDNLFANDRIPAERMHGWVALALLLAPISVICFGPPGETILAFVLKERSFKKGAEHGDK